MKPNPPKSPTEELNQLPAYLLNPSPTLSRSETLRGEPEGLTGDEQLNDFIEAEPTMPAEFFADEFPLRQVKIGFTGHLKSGKDYVARALGAATHGFSEPLHALCKALFGTADKDQPGMRATMQTLGEWGRGIISEQCPASVQRAAFVAMIREQGEKLCPGLGVSWPDFGNIDLWANAALTRVAKSNNPLQVITGVRFDNEVTRLKEEGFYLVHVLCSPSTWERRLKAGGFTLDHPALKDVSEVMARTLTASVTKEVTRNPKGPKLLAVWSDEFFPPPSPRLLTVTELQTWIATKQRGDS